MTALGNYFHKKSINKSEVARRTGLSKARITQLTNNEKTKITAKELYLIFLAIHVNPGDEFVNFHQDVKLKIDSPEPPIADKT